MMWRLWMCMLKSMPVHSGSRASAVNMFLLNILYAVVTLGAIVLLFIIPKKSAILDFFERTGTYIFYHILLTFYALPLGQYGMKLREKSFSKVLSCFAGPMGEAIGGHKTQVYASLKKLGEVKKMPVILEVGAGNGANFDHYPEECDVIIVEPNKAFKRILEDKFKDMPKRRLKKFVQSGAESMDDIEDNSVDAVVSSHLLCSVGDAGKVLREIHRVLKPGGKFYFFEHILDRPGTIRRRVQSAINWKYLWPAWFLGCEYCDTADDIAKIDFSAVNARKIQLEFKGFTALHLVAPHFIGDATK